MAENQGVNGDMWNDRAVQLFHLFGWTHIGDKNMDLPGSDDKEYGVDALMCYDSPRIAPLQSCILESKRYSMSSLSKSKVQGWIRTLKTKIDALCQSDELIKEFPVLTECCEINTGVICCWVHDAPDVSFFHNTLSKYLSEAIIKTVPSRVNLKRIVFLSNLQILKLCSIADLIEKDTDYNYQFVYPAQLIGGRPLVRSATLSLEYVTSDIILAERNNKGETQAIVFYLGEISLDGFRCLQEALTMYNIIEQGKGLRIFYYGDDISARPIIAEAKNLFNDVKVTFKPLQQLNLTSEPTILLNNDEE